jgi:UDP-glucose 4-epimerase
MRALVTGGAGFIGSHLVDALIARGDEVVVLDDLSNGRRENLADALERGARLEVEDVRDGAAVERVLSAARPEVAFHLAAQIDVRVSVADPALDARTNVEGTVNVLEASRRAGTRRVVFASTGGGIYGDVDEIPTTERTFPQPMAPYGQSKQCAEAYLGLFQRLHDLSSVPLRFGNVYGPRQDPHGDAGVIAIFCGRLKEGRPLTIFGDGTQTRDYIYVGDLVDALVIAGDSDVREPINIGTEEETSVLELAEILREVSGADSEIEFKPARLGELQRSCLAVGRARELLGWSAATDVREGLRRTWEATSARAGS